MTGQPLLSIREWLAGGPFPWPAPLSLRDGEPLVACFCVVDFQRDQTRTGKPYLRLRLMDRHGALPARVWEDAERVAELAESAEALGVRGRLETFKEERQLKVEEVAPLRVAPEEMELFLPRSARSAEAMERELTGWIASVEDAGLRRLLERVLDAEGETGRRFRVVPAAKRNHHAYLGGLLEHTLSLTAACQALARHYGAVVDRDLLIAGALLHDVGKVREIGVEPGFPYTDEGKLLGHIVLGIGLVEDAAREVPELSGSRRTLLLHLIASHQGRYEWQSPREPCTVEALILHYADDLDAKLTQALRRLSEVSSGWTGYDRAFGRDLLRHGPVPPPPERPAGHDNGSARATRSPPAGGSSPGRPVRGGPADPGPPGGGAALPGPAHGGEEASSPDPWPPWDPPPESLDLFEAEEERGSRAPGE